ncbi:hypothetical protein J4219_04175 [Candidatus Woesearchaeota archaeon]|nr:hypothetical protein [Candidatus Woesearchaeota archaeon]
MKRGQVSNLSWLFLALMAILAIALIYLFIAPLVEAAANVIILYFIALRLYGQVIRREQWEMYGLSMLAGLFVMILLGNIPLLWMFTEVLLAGTLIAELYKMAIS